MLIALEQSLGIVTTACIASNVPRATHYYWLREDKDYKAAVEDIENIALDFAESQLHEQIRNSDTAATIFYLKCKGKKRGYIERTEIAGVADQPIIWQETKVYQSEVSVDEIKAKTN